MGPQAYEFTNSKGVKYYLNGQEVTLNGGRKQLLYYFSKDLRAKTAVAGIPEGRVVGESARTGLPILRKAS